MEQTPKRSAKRQSWGVGESTKTAALGGVSESTKTVGSAALVSQLNGGIGGAGGAGGELVSRLNGGIGSIGQR